MRILLIGVLAILAVGAADWAAWAVLTARLGTAFTVWSETMHEQGFRVSSAAPISTGFPFAATLILPDFSLSGGDSAVPGGMGWTADEVDLSLTWAHPGRLLIAPGGHQMLRISRSPKIAFSADDIAAWVPLGRLEAKRAANVELTADAVSGGIEGSHHPGDVGVAHLNLHLTIARDAAGRTDAGLHIEARDIALPDTGRWPLGATVAAFSADASLASPALAQIAMDEFDDSNAEAAAEAWRAGNGQIDIRGLDLKWGPLSLGGQAVLGLDAKLQPAGQGTARAAGYNEALDALAAGKTISPGVADTAKAVLGLMGRTPADSAPGVELPLTLKDSTLSVGKIPLTRVNAVDWGRV